MGKVSINGNTVNVPSGATISIRNNVLYVNGTRWDGEGNGEFKTSVAIVVDGDLLSLQTDGEATVNGDVHGNVDAGNGVTVSGMVKGNVDAGNSCTCGDVGGSVDAGNSVHCGNVGGDVDAGNNVYRR